MISISPTARITDDRDFVDFTDAGFGNQVAEDGSQFTYVRKS
jgi:hypothetical protein